MAEATTRPRSRRAKAADEAPATPAKTTPAKATKAAPAAAAPIKGEDGRVKTPIVLEYTGDTKSYAVFVPPAGSGCVGKFYAPLGTEEVKVLLISPAS
jgi:hypothetical protein